MNFSIEWTGLKNRESEEGTLDVEAVSRLGAYVVVWDSLKKQGIEVKSLSIVETKAMRFCNECDRPMTPDECGDVFDDELVCDQCAGIEDDDSDLDFEDVQEFDFEDERRIEQAERLWDMQRGN